jgi:N-glycosylase/DNA lyase
VRTYTTTNTHSASGAYLEGSHFARRGVRKLEQYRVRKVEDSLETSRREKRLGDGFGGWRKDLEGWVWEGR